MLHNNNLSIVLAMIAFTQYLQCIVIFSMPDCVVDTGVRPLED